MIIWIFWFITFKILPPRFNRDGGTRHQIYIFPHTTPPPSAPNNFSHHALTGLRRSAARLPTFPKSAAAPAGRNLGRRRLNRRRDPSGTKTPSPVGSAPIYRQSCHRRRSPYSTGGWIFFLRLVAAFLLVFVGELNQLARDKRIVPYQSRRALSPEWCNRSL